MDTPEGVIVAIVLALVGGGGGYKLIEFLWEKWRGQVTRRRAEVDRATKIAASSELRARLLTESLHDHRNMMLKSGLWTRETLPPFMSE